MLLQAERAALVRHQHLLTCLEEVLGQYRSNLQDDDDEGESSQGAAASSIIEYLLLEQLTVVQLPALAVRTRRIINSTSSSSSGGCRSLSDAAGWDTASFNSSVAEASHGSRSSPDTPFIVNPHSSTGDSCLQEDQLLVPAAAQEPVSPASHPFLLLQAVCDQPFDPRARDITLPELLGCLRSDTQELGTLLKEFYAAAAADVMQRDAIAPAESCNDASAGAVAGNCDSQCDGAYNSSRPAPSMLQQQQQEDCPVEEKMQEEQQQSPLQRIQAIQMRAFVMVNCLARVGRPDLFFQAQLANWETGEGNQQPCISDTWQQSRHYSSPLHSSAAWHWGTSSFDDCSSPFSWSASCCTSSG